jgi:hypothetical protein
MPCTFFLSPGLRNAYLFRTFASHLETTINANDHERKSHKKCFLQKDEDRGIQA